MQGYLFSHTESTLSVFVGVVSGLAVSYQGDGESNFSFKNNVQHWCTTIMYNIVLEFISKYVIAIFDHDLYILCSYTFFSSGIYYMHLFPHISLVI